MYKALSRNQLYFGVFFSIYCSSFSWMTELAELEFYHMQILCWFNQAILFSILFFFYIRHNVYVIFFALSKHF